MLGSTASSRISFKKYDEKHKETRTIWDIFAYYFTIYLFTTNNWIVCDDHFRVSADVYSLILTMGLVGNFLLLIWWLKRKMLFIFEKKKLELVICLLLICNLCGLSDSLVILGAMLILINHRIFMMSIYRGSQMDNQPFYRLSYLFVFACNHRARFEETLDRGYFMNTFFF